MGGIYNPPVGGGGQPSDPFTLGTAPDTATFSGTEIELTDGTFTTTVALPNNTATKLADNRRYEMAHSTLGYFDADSVSYVEPNAFSNQGLNGRFEATEDHVYVRNLAGTVGVQLGADGTIYLDGSIATMIRQRVVSAPYATYGAIATAISNANAVPSAASGTQIHTLTITPKKVGSTIALNFLGYYGGGSGTNAAALLTQAGVTVAAAANSLYDSVGLIPLAIHKEIVTVSLAAITFTIRVGPVNAGTIYSNGSSANRYFGGVLESTFSAIEYAA